MPDDIRLEKIMIIRVAFGWTLAVFVLMGIIKIIKETKEPFVTLFMILFVCFPMFGGLIAATCRLF